MKYTFSIMRFCDGHVDEICEDIKQQVEQGITTMPLFSLTLVPEGKTPSDKAAAFCEKYDIYKEKLDKMGIPSGVLVQASIGHGWLLGEMFPYQQYVGFDGVSRGVVCPYDRGFHEYIYKALRTIALHKPSHIMIDDDLRLIHRDGGGCTCPLHLKRFNELAKANYTRDELSAMMLSKDEKYEALKEIFIETQKESLLGVAKTMREAIDSVDETLPGSYSCVGNPPEFGGEIAEILAGKGNKVMARVNNAFYSQHGTKYFTWSFFRAASQRYRIKDKVDVVLAETDTCPQNRYSTSACMLHSHFTGSLLEGLGGAKHWITRVGFEPQSGVAYRKILAKYSKFYDALTDIVPSVKWTGLRMPISKKKYITLKSSWGSDDDTFNEWAKCVFERMGLPMYSDAEIGGVTCLDGNNVKMTDEEIKEMLGGCVILSSDSAKTLCDRGFSGYIGVEVCPWEGESPNVERILLDGKKHFTAVQRNLNMLKITGENVTVSSMIYNTKDNENFKELFPGAVIYKNSLGGKVMTFAGSPKAEHNIVEAYAFLNYYRKQQIISFLKETAFLPAYFTGDEEVYLKCGHTEEGKLICAIFNLGLDKIEKLEMQFEKAPRKIRMLSADGTLKEAAFSIDGGKCVIDITCETLIPAILLVE